MNNLSGVAQETVAGTVPPAVVPGTRAKDTCGDEAQLLASLRRGDESAFAELVQRHHSALLRLARMYVSSPAVAEEVVQETWIGVLRGLERFEGRSSLKTWIFHILVNRARTRGERESRMLPFSALSGDGSDTGEPAADPALFLAEDSERPGMWACPPREWTMTPEEILLSAELRSRTEAVIAELPPSQREVITLRDIQGWNSEEVCNALGLSETNQRVLLHRARTRVRQGLNLYLGTVGRA